MTRYILLFFISLCLACSPQPAPKKNVLFILVDDLGWNDLGVYGSTFHETPRLDKFASQSLMFTQAYSASPVCSPTRAAIMTGKYPTRVDITDWIPGADPKDRLLRGPNDQHQLDTAETTLAEAFQQHGYKTFFAGKWHLGGEGFFPENHGFDINIGGIDKGSPPGGYFSPYKNPKIPDGPEGEYLTDRLTDEALSFMEKNKDQPFFLMMSFYTVHTPIQANEEYEGRFKKKLSHFGDSIPVQKRKEGDGETLLNQYRSDYASMVYAMDKNTGRLLDKLKELGLDENTVVVFTSDNGGLSTLYPNRNPPTSVMPLRGGKGWCYEGGIRIPLIIRDPGFQGQNKTDDTPVISHDLYPTMLSLAGLEVPTRQKIDGYDLSPLMNAEALAERKSLFWHFPHYHGSAWKPGAALRQGDWKLIEFYEEGKTELYNLKEGQEEMHDLSAEMPELTKELKEELKRMQEETGAKMPKVNL